MKPWMGITLGFGLAFGWGTLSVRADLSVGKFAQVVGDVKIKGKDVKKGEPIPEGVTIVVKEGKATLLLGDENVVYLDKNSKFKVTEYRKDIEGEDSAVFDLRYGRTRALVKSQGHERKSPFKFRARSAVMGVRGTHVLIDAPRDPSAAPTFMTLAGKADVAVAGQNFTLGANQALSAGGPESTGQAAAAGTGVREVKPEEAQAAAVSVAPPAPEVRTGEDLAEVAENGIEDFVPDEGDGGFHHPPPPPPPFDEIPLDPLLDGDGVDVFFQFGSELST